MPDLLPRESSIAIAKAAVQGIRKDAVKEAVQIGAADINYHPERQVDAVSAATEHQYEFVGSGYEDMVIGKAEEPDKVIAINFSETSPLSARTLFWGHRIAHVLFPHNFPRFHAARGDTFNSEGSHFTGTIRQRVTPTDQRLQYPIQDALETIQNLGISFELDRTPRNFVIGADGGQYYLDKLIVRNVGNWDTARITNYMKEHNYAERDMHQVQVAIERLKEIEKIRSQAVF